MKIKQIESIFISNQSQTKNIVILINCLKFKKFIKLYNIYFITKI